MFSKYIRIFYLGVDQCGLHALCDGINLLVDEIMASATPTKDKFVKNTLKWDMPGSLNGTQGVWVLIVDLDKHEIINAVTLA